MYTESTYTPLLHIARGLSMERPEKLRKLNAFRRRLPHVSASALAAILTAVHIGSLPDLHDRSALRESRDMQAQQDTSFGPILQHIEVLGKNDVSVQLPIAHPFAMLWTAVTDCRPFMEFFAARILEKPPTPEDPWNILCTATR